MNAWKWVLTLTTLSLLSLPKPHNKPHTAYIEILKIQQDTITARNETGNLLTLRRLNHQGSIGYGKAKILGNHLLSFHKQHLHTSTGLPTCQRNHLGCSNNQGVINKQNTQPLGQPTYLNGNLITH